LTKRWHSGNHCRVCLQGNYIKVEADNYSPIQNMFSPSCESASAISGTRWRHYRTPLFNGVILATCQVCRELRPFVLSRRRVYNRESRKALSFKADPQRKQDRKKFQNSKYKYVLNLTVTGKETAIRADTQQLLIEQELNSLETRCN
jgi:hypothetical protein